MQSHWESKEAPFGFPLFDHRKPFIYIKSSACLRPVVHSQNSAKQESWRHVRAVHPSQLYRAVRRSTISVTELQQVGCTSQRASHWELPFYLALRLQRLGVGVCLRLRLFACAPLFLSALSTPFWNKCTALAHRLCWLDEPPPFFLFPICLTRKLVPPASN